MQVMARRDAVRDAGDMSNIPPPNLDESQLAALVDRFYDKVRVDPLLGPVFAARVEDWDTHKILMTSFWATVALRSGHYRGNPLAKHQPLPIGAGHFQRWLALWRETANALLDAESAVLMAGYAERIGYGMRVGMGLSGHLRGRESGIPIRARQPGGAPATLRGT
jgi:hemoglobin